MEFFSWPKSGPSMIKNEHMQIKWTIVSYYPLKFWKCRQMRAWHFESNLEVLVWERPSRRLRSHRVALTWPSLSRISASEGYVQCVSLIVHADTVQCFVVLSGRGSLTREKDRQKVFIYFSKGELKGKFEILRAACNSFLLPCCWHTVDYPYRCPP
jgi:hypothetical protein